MADDKQTKRRSPKRAVRKPTQKQELHLYLGDGRDIVIMRVKQA